MNSEHKTQIIIALIGMIGVIGAALIAVLPTLLDDQTSQQLIDKKGIQEKAVQEKEIQDKVVQENEIQEKEVQENRIRQYLCKGQTLETALRIVHETLEIGFDAGLTGNAQAAYTEGLRLSREAQKLPPSCQELISVVGDHLQGVYNRDQVFCYRGVCCDGVGCVEK